jgi:type I restriction enzyme M protein
MLVVANKYNKNHQLSLFGSSTNVNKNKKRNYSTPEEKVQAEAYLKLILNYGYPKENIVQFVSVKMGVSSKEADIIVYKDKEHTQPHIVVANLNF